MGRHTIRVGLPIIVIATLVVFGADPAVASSTVSLSATDLATCGGASTVTVSFQAQNPPPVEQVADIELLIDESGSISSIDFSRIKQSMFQFVSDAGVSAAGNHVGVTLFSSTARVIAPLLGDAATLQDDIGRIAQDPGATATQAGLALANQQLVAGGRPGVPRVIIIETDGQWNVQPNPAPTAAALVASGTEIFAVGVGAAISQPNLLDLTGGIASRVFQIDDFASLESAFEQALQRAIPAATDAVYSAGVAPGWQVTGTPQASDGTVVFDPSDNEIGWTDPVIDAPNGKTITISYALSHTGTTGGRVPLHSSAVLTWTDDQGAHSQDFSDAAVNVAGCNQPPVPNAGPDQTIELSGSHTTTVTLDGSASTDDGQLEPLSYSWAEGTTPLGTGSTLPVSLGLGTHTITLTVDDGQYTSSDDVQITVVDPSPPTITPTITGTLGTNGWYRSDVDVTWAVSDAESDITSAPCAGGSVTSDGTGTTFDCSATSAGGTSTATTGPINRDATNPTITYRGNADTYPLTSTVAITCTAADNLSGVSSSTCTDINGPAYAFGPGASSFSATATDNAGNTGSGSTRFTVTATPPELCDLAVQFMHESPRYQHRTQPDGPVPDAPCALANHLRPNPDGPAKVAFLRAYDHALDGLVTAGWLTASRAATLRDFAAAL